VSGECVECGAAEPEHMSQCDTGELIQLRAEVERLTSKVSDLETELVGWQDRDAEWQTATGLMRGGDPGGVEPRHLQDHIQALSRLEQAARAFAMDDVRAIPALFNELRSAVLALPPDAP
jgi:hypothetical protein